MAQPRLGGTIKEADFVDIEGDAEDVTAITDSNERELRDVLSSLGADPDDQEVYINIKKQVPGYKKPWECFVINPSELPGLTDRLRKEYGSGFYIANVVKNGKLFKKIELPVLAPSKQEFATAPASDLAGVVKALQENSKEQFAQMRQLFLEATGRQATPTNPIEMMTAMMGAMSAMKEFITPPQQGNNMDMFFKAAEFVRDLKGDSGGDSNFIDVIRDFVKSPIAGELVDQVKSARAMQPIAVPSAPQSHAAPAMQHQQPPIGGQPPSMQQQMIIAYINRLVAKAKAGGSPDLQADNILEDFPEDLIRQHLLGSDTIDRLAQINPEVNQYREWFAQLQHSLQEAFKDAERTTATGSDV